MRSSGPDRISCGYRDTCGKEVDPLCSRWQRSNNVDSFYGEKLTDLLKTYLGVSRRDGLAYGGGLDFYYLTLGSGRQFPASETTRWSDRLRCRYRNTQSILPRVTSSSAHPGC